MQLIRKSKIYLIKILSNLLKSLNSKHNKEDTIYALPYKRGYINNKIEEKENSNEYNIIPFNSDNSIHIVSSYIKSIKIKKK